MLFRSFGVIDGLGATDGTERAFERADAGFARVRGDEVEEGVVVHGEERSGEDVRFELLGDEVLPCDMKLLVVLRSGQLASATTPKERSDRTT